MTTSKLPDNPTSEDLADTRTAWAEDRTILANERTFAGWMRTGMACIALALGLKALFRDAASPLLAKSIAEIFIVAAIFIFWTAALKSAQAQRRITSHDTEPQPSRTMIAIATILTIGAIAIGVILWRL